MIENVYFVENLHGIQYFLSSCELNESNLVVMSENRSLHQFLREIMPNENKIAICGLRLTPYPSLTESLSSTRHSLPSRLLRKIYYLRLPVYQLFHVLFWRIYYTRLLKGIRPPAKAYFFSKCESLHFFVLLGYLARKGIDIRFIDGISESFYMERIEEQHLFPRFYLWVLGLAAGVKLARAQARYWQFLELVDSIHPTACHLDSWELLAEKYHWAHINRDRDAILLVDGPIQTISGANIKDTQKNLVRFFTPFLEKGVQIHLKPHYNHPEIDSFDGTQLGDEIKKLPSYFPVELIMNHYQSVYFFASVSGSTPIKGKKCSLANLMVFNSEEKRDLFWKLCQDDFSKEMGVIEFVTPR